MNFDLQAFLPDFLEVTKSAAIASYQWIGRGDKMAADDAAVKAMRNQLKRSYLNATVVVGEGEMDKAPMLYTGEEFGNHPDLLHLDLAVDPLEGTNLCANGSYGALTVLAFAKKGDILNCPDIYMEKLVVAPDFIGAVDIDFSLEKNLLELANAKECKMKELKVIMLNRPRHKENIDKARQMGCKVILIEDGDIAAVLSVLLGINDIYIGIGGAPEGVLAAAAIKAFRGDIQARLIFNNNDEKIKAEKCGITNFNKKYHLRDMIKGEVYFVASGVTKGDVLDGVSYDGTAYEVESMVISSKNHEMQIINSSRLI